MLPLDCVDKNFSMKPIDYLEKNSSNRYFSGQYPLEKKSPTHTNCNVITTICTDILTRKIDLQSFFSMSENIHKNQFFESQFFFS